MPIWPDVCAGYEPTPELVRNITVDASKDDPVLQMQNQRRLSQVADYIGDTSGSEVHFLGL